MISSRAYNLHLPDDVRVFEVPDEGVRRRDEAVLVYDVAVPGGLVLRHLSLSDRWFEINWTLDCDARLVKAVKASRWAFNCDICTPHVLRDAAVYNVDLEIDVLVAADGRRRLVTDEDDFLRAVGAKWIELHDRRGALRGLADLLRIIDGDGGLLAFAQSVLPFTPFRSTQVQPPAGRLGVSDIPELRPDRRRAACPRGAAPCW